MKLITRVVLFVVISSCIFFTNDAHADYRRDMVGEYITTQIKTIFDEIDKDILVDYTIQENTLIVGVIWPMNVAQTFFKNANKEEWESVLTNLLDLCLITKEYFPSFDDIVIAIGYVPYKETVMLGYASAVLGIKDFVFDKEQGG